MAGTVEAELAELRLAVQRLTQGLQLMQEAQATQTEMLRAVLEAAAAPTEPGTRPESTLEQIATTLGEQTILLGAVRASLEALPRDVGQAVGEGLRQALTES